jgi:CelD/BcsL family acetyltransferase involved in cellulose biosynthesis
VLTVLSVAYPLAPVWVDAVGGAEQILAALDAALVAAGHRSIVIAAAGSVVAGELVQLPPLDGPLTTEAWCAAHAAMRVAIAETLQREHIDVVHMHGIDFHAYLPPPGPPVLVTLHLPLDWYPSHALACARPNTYLSCVSRTQYAAAPGGPFVSSIANGVDLQRLVPAPPPQDYALVLGRICAEKGIHLALDAATRAGVPLRIAGKVFPYPEHQVYFREQVEPRLHRPHELVGPVVGPAKAELIAKARCVVVPSIVAETSSLVAMEALACGTPVVAFERGALVELIEHGRNGLLVHDVAELADAIRDAPRLDRAYCRSVAEARCSGERMCERYLARYRELAAADRPRRASALRVEVVDLDGLQAMHSAWDALWLRDPRATVFQRPGWALPWCRRLLRGEVAALTAWRGGELAGLLPLFRWRDGDADVLSLVGAGVSDYQDLLVDDSDAVRALEAALARVRWDRLELSELRGDSPLLRFDVGGTSQLVVQEPCPALALAHGAPLGGVAAGLLHEIDYQRRRATREVGLDNEVLAPAQLVPALAWLHHARWAARGQSGVLSPELVGFLSEVIAALDSTVLGVGVRFGGALAAVALGFVDRDVTRYYLGGFDPVHERRSPGTLAIAGAIEASARCGVRVFDFLRGAEPYKYRFGASDRATLYRRVVARRPGVIRA